jgi:hypothetical protein
MEILMDSNVGQTSVRKKKLNPIYIPVDVVSKLYRFDTKELLKLLFDHVSFTKSSNVKLDLTKLREHISKVLDNGAKKVEFNEPESGIIKTNYMSNDVDYSVTIKYPYFEYHNWHKNTIIVRPLITEDDYKLFFKTPVLLSTEWPGYALKCYSNYSQFNMFINGKNKNSCLRQFHSPSKSFKANQVPILRASSREETR